MSPLATKADSEAEEEVAVDLEVAEAVVVDLEVDSEEAEALQEVKTLLPDSKT